MTAKPSYLVTGASRLTVKARSSLHDTVTIWDKVEGTIEVDPAQIQAAGLDGPRFQALIQQLPAVILAAETQV